MPRFSIVIPTLRRPDTLRHALATAIAQTCEDIEIIVQNNGRDPFTEAVVQELNSPLIRHFWSDSVLTITQNWEAALANANGDVITFIGDDDGLFPDACNTAAQIIDRAGVEIVSWRPFCYYWPDYAQPELRNRLSAVADYCPHAQIVSSASELRRLYRFAIDYSQLPMIYNSFVRRTVVERITKELGRYFLGRLPDVTSGIVNAAYSTRFVRLSGPLSMTGLSRHSTGHNAFLSAREFFPVSRFVRDLGTAQLDDRLAPSDNFEFLLADDMLLLQERVPSMRGRVELDYYRLVQLIASTINNRPGSYDDTLAAMRALAMRHNIDLADIAIPAPMARKPAPEPGATAIGNNRIRFFIDGNAMRLSNVADAVRLMEQIAPPMGGVGAMEIRSEVGPDRVSVRRSKTFTFGLGGNGVPCLVNGWGEPEEWGTWSVAKRASISFTVDPPAAEYDPRRFAVSCFCFKGSSSPHCHMPGCGARDRHVDLLQAIQN